jgi:hypothetical protein
MLKPPKSTILVHYCTRALLVWGYEPPFISTSVCHLSTAQMNGELPSLQNNLRSSVHYFAATSFKQLNNRLERMLTSAFIYLVNFISRNEFWFVCRMSTFGCKSSVGSTWNWIHYYIFIYFVVFYSNFESHALHRLKLTAPNTPGAAACKCANTGHKSTILDLDKSFDYSDSRYDLATKLQQLALET